MNFKEADVIEGQYLVESLLGEGSAGSVYLVLDQLLNKKMAFKVLHDLDGAPSQVQIERFRREAQVLSVLDDPHIVKVNRYGVLPDGSPYLVLDFVDGFSLRDFIDKKGALTLHQAVSLSKQICSGLSSAAQKNVVHRDLKPENVLLNDSGTIAKIIDFGICKQISSGQSKLDPDRTIDPKLTKTGILLGTPAYMSPEQCMGKDADWRSDIYSLGCIFFEMITGKRPFQGLSNAEQMDKHVTQPLPKLSKDLKISGKTAYEIDQFIEKCCQKDPCLRFQSHDAVLSALGRLEQQDSAWIIPETKRDAPPARSKKSKLMSVSLVFVVIIGGTFFVKQTFLQKKIRSDKAWKIDVEQLLADGKRKDAFELASQFARQVDSKISLETKRRVSYELFCLFRGKPESPTVDSFTDELAISALESISEEAIPYAREKKYCDDEPSRLALADLCDYLFKRKLKPRTWTKIHNLVSNRTTTTTKDTEDVMITYYGGVSELNRLRAKSVLLAPGGGTTEAISESIDFNEQASANYLLANELDKADAIVRECETLALSHGLKAKIIHAMQMRCHILFIRGDLNAAFLLADETVAKAEKDIDILGEKCYQGFSECLTPLGLHIVNRAPDLTPVESQRLLTYSNILSECANGYAHARRKSSYQYEGEWVHSAFYSKLFRAYWLRTKAGNFELAKNEVLECRKIMDAHPKLFNLSEHKLLSKVLRQ